MRRLLVDRGGDLNFAAVLSLDGLRAGAQLRHRRAERTEVVDHRLVDEDVAIGEEEDPFSPPGLPQTPDDLKRRVGLAGAGGHHQQDAVLALGDGLDRRVDRDALVVARLFAAAVVVVVLEDDCFLSRRQALPLRYESHSCAGDGKSVERQLGFRLGALAGPIVEDEAVAVR